MSSATLFAAWAVALLPALAIAVMFTARLGERLGAARVAQRFLLGSLIVVGCLTLVMLYCDSSTVWVSTGVLVSLMSLGATVDLGEAERAAI